MLRLSFKAVESPRNATRGDSFPPRVIRIYRSKHLNKQMIALRDFMVTPHCSWWRRKAKKQKEASLGGAKGRATRFPSRESVDEYWQRRPPRAAYSGVGRTRREQSGQEVACEHTFVLIQQTSGAGSTGVSPLAVQYHRSAAKRGALLELHLSCEASSPSTAQPGHKGTMPAPTARRLVFTSAERCIRRPRSPESSRTWSHASLLVEARVPWLQSWTTRSDGENGSLTGRLARCLFTAQRIMELARIMLPQERRIDTCKGQVSALFVSLTLSHLPPFNLPDFAQEQRLALQDVYPGEHRAFRLDPCDHYYCICLCICWKRRQRCRQQFTPPRWLLGPSQCPKLVCLRSSQSLLELSR